MPLAPGLRLGPYEIEDAIGQGGMGEVYRARDTRLQRPVAIKVLSDAMAQNEERRARFEQEARSIAALNHPNICTLYDVGDYEGRTYLVMEYVEGETLERAIARLDRSGSRTGSGARAPGQTPTNVSAPGARPGLGRIERIVEIASQIADALEAAHRQGFIHRDLKPANVMLTRDGVKLLDFGLAKATSLSSTQIDEATQTGVVSAVSEARSLETTKAALTQPEKIVGTLRYASPEQLRGRIADRRSDIFSFGAVAYEMLSGHKAFDGSTDVTLIAAILEHDPVPLTHFRRDVPPALDRLVGECLAKDPEERWQSAGDIRRQLNALAAERDKEQRIAGGLARLRGGRLLWLAAGCGLAALLGALLVWQRDARHRDAPLAPLSRFAFVVPGLVTASKLAVSMDGRQVAVIARAKPDDVAAIFVRRADSIALHRVEGSENAEDVFFSPDGSEIGFAAPGRLMRAGRGDGAPVLLIELEHRYFGASWGSKGLIVFADHNGDLVRIDAGGARHGEVFADDVIRHHPRFLPDGEHLMFRRPADGQGMFIASIDGRGERQLTSEGGVGQVAPDGALVFQDGKSLYARGLDLERLEFVERAFRLPLDVEPSPEDDSFAISSSGTLVYLPRRPRHDLFVWHDRKGKALTRWEPGIENFSFSVSPDQTQLLVSAPVKDQQHRAIFLFDSRTGKTTQVSVADKVDHHDDPIWSPDGRSFAFVVHRTPSVIKHHDFATGNEVSLYTVKRGVLFLEDWSADGKKLVFVQKDYINQPQVGLLPLDGGPPQFHEVAGNNLDEVSLSPDGAWLAYQTLVGHIWEIFLAPWGGTTSVKLTPEGGVQPRFSRAGESIYFLGLDGKLMTVALPQPGSETVGLPNELFATGITTPSPYADQYRPSTSEDRFIIATPGLEAPRPVEVVNPWPRLRSP